MFSILPNNTLSRDNLSTEGAVKNIHYGDVLIKFGDVLNSSDHRIPFIKDVALLGNKVQYLRSGDIIIADTAEDDTVGKACELSISTPDKVVSGLHTIACRPRQGFAPGFLGYYINSPLYHKQLYPYMQGVKVTSISKGNIANTLIDYPDYDEQQQISCILGLVDQRIDRQCRLIDALKSYKRGVIETYFSRKINLFSRHNATGSCWEIKRLEDVTSEFKSGKSIPASEINSEGQYAVFGGNGIRGYTDHYSHDGQYVVVGRQGALCGNVRLVDGRNYLSEHAIAVKASEGNFTPFLLYLLDHMRLGQYSDQGAQPGLAVNKLVKLQHHFPSYEEQVTAATFFMKLDNRIETGNHLLSLLSSFKKGMLQAMFP